VRWVGYRRPAGGAAPGGRDTRRTLAGERLPAWRECCALVTGRADAGGAGHGERA
ncbi:MAG TPA: ParA family protein, partial [Rubrivivax sp.]|nr:ParA family protein [Rubrivivax sp.]